MTEQISIRLDSTAATNQTFTSTVPVIDGNYHHVAFVVFGNQLKVYIDGEENISSVIMPGDGFGNLVQDLEFAPNDQFQGIIDEFAFWETNLGPNEVAVIFNRQKAKFSGTIESRVHDIGLSSYVWSNLFWQTPLPFSKELTGSLGSELTSDYSELVGSCLLYTSPSPRDRQKSRMPSSA